MRSIFLTIVLLSAGWLFSCDDGKIYPKEEVVSGRQVDASFVFEHPETFPESEYYQVVFAAFENGGIYPLSFKKLSKPAAGENACLGLDAESLSSPPPAETAFAPDGRGRGVPLPAEEALRCWTLKESLAKAAGTGLDCPPDRIPCGRHGQRRGALYWRERTFFWRTLPVPGHWLALTGTRPLRPIFRIIPTACLGRPHASRDLR